MLISKIRGEHFFVSADLLNLMTLAVQLGFFTCLHEEAFASDKNVFLNLVRPDPVYLFL